MVRHCRWMMVVVVAVLCTALTEARGWQQKQPKSQLDSLPDKNVTGKLKGIQGNLLVLEVSGKDALVQPGQAVQLTVMGKAEPDFLTPGRYVQFTAPLNKQGVVKGKLSKLSVVELTPTTKPGAFAEGDPGTKPAGDDDFVPFFVRGQVRSLRDGQLQVSVPGMMIRAELSDKPNIDVGLSDIRLASEGDSVAIKAKEVQPGAFVAERITITTSQPLSAKKRTGR